MNQQQPSAAFVVAYTETDKTHFAATTRKKGIGFPGGKIEAGETAEDAARRETLEEGWSLPSDAKLTFLHEQIVNTHLVFWFYTDSIPTKLSDYLEKGTYVTPIVATKEEMLNSGMGNDNAIKQLK